MTRLVSRDVTQQPFELGLQAWTRATCVVLVTIGWSRVSARQRCRWRPPGRWRTSRYRPFRAGGATRWMRRWTGVGHRRQPSGKFGVLRGFLCSLLRRFSWPILRWRRPGTIDREDRLPFGVRGDRLAELHAYELVRPINSYIRLSRAAYNAAADSDHAT